MEFICQTCGAAFNEHVVDGSLELACVCDSEQEPVDTEHK